MALRTLGSNATTSLQALTVGTGDLIPADVASLSNQIRDDLILSRPQLGQAYSRNGILFFPNRGWLKCLPGDYVAVDGRGWPILLSADTIANGPWTHT